jgi:ubiquinone/menaquinone biosynthesis C-methylase UbiE/rhodanese-related sulfurtransferase
MPVLDWDRVSDVADHFAACVVQASDKLLELGGLMPGKTVIDLACGAGSLCRTAAERVQGNGGWVIGLDTSPRMVDVAKQQTPGVTHLEFYVHDAAVLGFPDGSCDVVFARFALPFLAQPAAVLARSLSVLKPGGRLAVMGIGGAIHNEFFTALGDLVGEPLQRSLAYGDSKKLGALLADTGFENVRTRSVRALVTVEQPQTYWSCIRGMFGIGPAEMPAAVAARVQPGARLSLELVYALGTKHDPGAPATVAVRGKPDMVAIARRSIRELTPYEVKRKIKDEQIVILDIRESTETQTRVKNSINIPRGELEKHVRGVVPDPKTFILTYCGVGGDSAMAARQLQELGYENVWNLYGGLKAWIADGMPVDRA